MADPPDAVIRRFPCRLLGLIATLIALAAVRGDEPRAPNPKAPAEAKANAAPDGLKVPPGTIIIISDKPADALRNVNAVVISPEEYRRLLDAAEQARRAAPAEKPELPSSCRLSGRVETRGAVEVAVLRAEFEFRTAAPRAIVELGLQRGRPTAATLDDGKPAVLLPDKEDEGFSVLVDQPGDHRLRVDLELPVNVRGARGGERGFELGLAGAAITTLERLEFPAGTTKVRLAGRTFAARVFVPEAGQGPAAVLGPQPRLDVAWDVPAPATPVIPLFAAEGRVEVRIEERVVTTRARLTFKVLRGRAGEFRLQAPASADVTVDGGDSSAEVVRPADAKKPVWTLRREPSADDLAVEVSWRTPVSKPDAIRVQAVLAPGAAQQRGTLVVGGPANLRIGLRPLGDVARRDAADDTGRDAVFSYWAVPASGVLLEADAQPVRGEVESQVTQQLTLTERGWRWQGRFDLRPVRMDVMALELDVPDDLQDLHATSAELVEGVVPVRELAPRRKLVRVQFAEARRRAVSLLLEGLYPHGSTAGTASLPLPRPLGTLDRGGQVVVTAPPGLEVRGVLREWDRDRVGDWDRPLDPAPRGGAGVSAAVERAPARLDLGWRSPRSETSVSSVVEITLGERQALVRQRWRIPTGADSARPIVARAPVTLNGRVRAVRGGTLSPTATPGEWQVQPATGNGTEHEIAIAYSIPLPQGTEAPTIDVPMVWLDAYPRCETEVRVWPGHAGAGAALPELAGGPWTELPPAVVADQPSLPALTLYGSGTGLPLRLRLMPSEVPAAPPLVVERVWGQVLVDEDGQHSYRVRYRVRPRQSHALEVELPAALAAIRFAASVDGKQIPAAAPDSGAAAGRTARLRLDPAPDHGPRILEVAYTLVPRASERAQPSSWVWTLSPPAMRGAVEVGPARWQVMLPQSDLAVPFGGFAAEDRWDWQRGLVVSRPAWSSDDLARWLNGGERPTTAEPAITASASVAGRQTGPGPIRFVLIPRSLALLLASLAVVALGLAAARWGGRLLWSVGGAALAAVVAWAWTFWPRSVALVLSAAQPGMVVLAGALVARWFLQRRYRRRVLFLPGFARGQIAGATARSGSSVRPRGEPSTVDEPAAL